MSLTVNHPKTYYFAAIEKIEAAETLFKQGVASQNQGHFVCSLYYSGVAVESMFRAFILRKTNQESWDTVIKRDLVHNLFKLEKDGGIFSMIQRSDIAKEYVEAKNFIIKSWDNLYRFSYSLHVENHVRSLNLITVKKGSNYLKNVSQKTVSSAKTIVQIGKSFLSPVFK